MVSEVGRGSVETLYYLPASRPAIRAGVGDTAYETPAQPFSRSSQLLMQVTVKEDGGFKGLCGAAAATTSNALTWNTDTLLMAIGMVFSFNDYEQICCQCKAWYQFLV